MGGSTGLNDVAEAVAALVTRPDTPTQAIPLSSAEHMVAARLSARLRAEFRLALRSLPSSARTIAGLSRCIGVERTVCQRFVTAIERLPESAELLAALPGPRSLRSIVTALRTSGANPEHVQNAEMAVDQFERFLDKIGGTHAALRRRVNASQGVDLAGLSTDTPGEDAALRLFHAARETVGRWSETQIQIAAFAPSSPDLSAVHVLRGRAFLGSCARADAPPLALLHYGGMNARPSGEAPRHYESLECAPDSEPRHLFMVDEFAGPSQARLVTRRSGRFLVQLADVDDPSLPNDIVVAHRSGEPRRSGLVDDPPVEEVWVTTDFPTRHLLLDVYQHRELARRSVASADVHIWRANVLETVGERWDTKVNTPASLELLGRGIASAAHASWGRHGEFTRWLFEQAGWNPEEFVGFRLSVPYPRWRLGYRMLFDYGTGS